MTPERAFETVWLCGGKELERRTVQADGMDAALAAAWMELPAISRRDHKPCDTMRITCRRGASGLRSWFSQPAALRSGWASG
jgi:hypothetical protein